MQLLTAFFQRLPVRAWLLLGVFLLLWKLDYAPFWNPDEGRYAAAALEMSRPFDGSAPDWVVPRLNSVPRLNKPPLVYWLGASSYRALGASEFAARLVPALAALAVMFGIYFLGRTLFDERAAVASAIIWASALLPAALGRTFNTDMLLTATMYFAFGGIYLAGEVATCRYSRIRPYLWSGVGMGLALLAKGPVGVALPLLIGAIYLTLAGRWSRVKWSGVAGAVVLALLIGVPWYLAVEAREHGFLRRFLLEENLGRFSGSQEFHEKTQFWFYLPVVLVGMVPWACYFPVAVSRVHGWRLRHDDPWLRARLFCWLWALGLIGFFSLSGTKLISYVLPAFPAFALILGESFGGAALWNRDIRHWCLGVASLLNTVLAAASFRFLTDGKTVPPELGLRYAGAVFAVLAVATAVLWLVRTDRWKLFIVQGVGACALLTLLLSLAGRLAYYEDSSPMVKSLLPHLKADDVFVEYRTFQPTAIFYAARPVPSYEFTNTSGLDEKHPNYNKVFPRGTEAMALREAPGRVFVLTRWNHGHPEQFTGWNLIGHNNDFRLYSNRPAPEGYSYNFVAPGKADR